MLVLIICPEEIPGMVVVRGSALLSLCLFFGALQSALTFAQRIEPAQPSAAAPSTPAEARAAKAFQRARSSEANGLALEAFLRKMPKGGDLHMHLSGAIYAETFIKDAAKDGICVNSITDSFIREASHASGRTCGEGAVPAEGIFKDQKLYHALVDAFSMRSFIPTPGVSGHDQFFATFDRFGALDKSHTGEWLDEVASRAAAQNEQYLEVMVTPTFTASAKLGYSLGWPSAPVTDAYGDISGTSAQQLADLRDKLLAGAVGAEAAIDREELADALAARNRIEHCGEPSAKSACAVTVRFIYQLLRAFPPQQVFAQTVLGFEVASSDPNVVGVNYVQPEDNYMAMSEYSREMHMLDYLHGVYPKVHITMHAGELTPGLVPPDGTTFHIREAVDLGHAERIGHGVDVMHETDPRQLLREMADRHIMVEINLTSNDVILGVVPPFHPLPLYREARVPVALSTDDEGVSRIDLTHEYVRAALEYHLGYLDLKQMARTSIEHSFLAGESLWDKPDAFTRTKTTCAGQKIGAESPAGSCLAFLKANQKAAQQWELEHRFAVFESTFQ
jgi:adenosine deaminase